MHTTVAHLLEEPLAALVSSSAKHSAMVLMLRNAASRAPVVSSQIACVREGSSLHTSEERVGGPGFQRMSESVGTRLPKKCQTCARK